jgi:hypothetical protein
LWILSLSSIKSNAAVFHLYRSSKFDDTKIEFSDDINVAEAQKDVSLAQKMLFYG